MNITRPSIVCKATEHIGEMIALIQRIEKNGFTYFAGGNLYFDISKFPSYGELALLCFGLQKANLKIRLLCGTARGGGDILVGISNVPR